MNKKKKKKEAHGPSLARSEADGKEGEN